MDINEHLVHNVSFIVRDVVTGQRFGGRMNFDGLPLYESLPVQINFSCVEELQDVITLLTNIYEKAMATRSETKWVR